MPIARQSASLVAILTSLVEERMGMHYEAHDSEIFVSKLSARALESGFESLLDYYYFLRYDDADGREFDALIDSLVVNETYFLREIDQLRVLVRDIIAKAVANSGRPRIWCAAASTGEEPLTLALLLAEEGLLDRVEIVASDISRRALSRAFEGTFGGRSLRVLDERTRAKWFDEQGDMVKVRREIHRAIAWLRVNLLDDEAIASLGSFDVILCRNVLIYFSEATVAQVTKRLADSLRPGGVLLVGVSESLMRFGTLLKCEERGGSFFYTKATP
jgi:chemotaxis protein methyltransferase CheR